MNKKQSSGLISWFARNPVAANLMMIVILVAGLASFFTIKRTLNPNIQENTITITVPYLGAAPEEVERSVTVKIEQRIKDIDGIARYYSVSSKSLATITVDVAPGYSVDEVLGQIQTRVESIKTFPKEIEKPIIARNHPYNQALMIEIYGDMDEAGMKTLAQQIKLEMQQNPLFSNITIHGTRNYEISIEIPEESLRKYHLTINEVVRAINASSIDIPGGTLKTDSGNILLRASGQAYSQYDFENIVLRTFPDSSQIRLGDIAKIKDGFADVDGFARFNGKPSVALSVSAASDQNVIQVARAAKAYVKEKQKTLPKNVKLTTWGDATYYLKSRMEMMGSNLLEGALLVFIILALFLDLKSAFWVMAGIPVAFLGSFILMPLSPFNVSFNMISLFGFLTVLGIVVDDATVTAESIHAETDEYGNTLDNLVKGAEAVAVPVTYGVLTTIAAFAPTVFVEGPYASIPQAIGYVVIFCLSFSLLESKWILPAHLAHYCDDPNKPKRKPSKPNRITQFVDKLREKTDYYLKIFIEEHYRPFLVKSLEYRYVTLAVFIAMLILTAGLVTSGIVRVTLIPDIPSDFLIAKVEMREGTSSKQIRNALSVMENAIINIDKEYKQKHKNDPGLVKDRLVMSDDGNIGMIMLELVKSEKRTLGSKEIIKRWRQRVGEIAGSKLVTFSSIEDAGGPPLAFKLLGSNTDQLVDAANDLEKKLNHYDGVFDIVNGSSDVNDELYIKIKPSARSLGLTLADIGTQVREAFYGAEAQRVQRGNEEVRVMVRFPKSERSSLSSLENMYISTPTGSAVPFSAVASVDLKRSLARYTRVNGQKAITVAAHVDKSQTQPGKINDDIMKHFAKELKAKYPGVTLKLDGAAVQAQQLMVKLIVSLILAVLVIYVLLAIPLRSYAQPLMIMSVIPFGIIGAIVGHIVMNISINMLSFFGIIALTGVVVNDSLVLVDFINTAKDSGLRLRQAIVETGIQRFRAVLITSLTTFAGLLPILFEKSLQAQLVIPMAVSLSFGIVFSTVITLILIPCLYHILIDVEDAWRARKSARAARQRTQPITE